MCRKFELLPVVGSVYVPIKHVVNILYQENLIIYRVFHLFHADCQGLLNDCHISSDSPCHSALRLVGQEPEPSQATDMALACCFLDKVLGVGCH